MAYTTVNKALDYFNTKLYTGNNASSKAITGVGFKPDFTWLKGRNIAESHRLYDAVRGASNYVTSNATGAQSSSIPLTSFNSDGFTIGTNDDSVNGSYNYASWNWKANGQGSSNTDGTINSTYTSASTTSGFSIVKYTGTGSNATVGHGLGVAPKMMMVKKTSGTSSWRVYTSMTGNTSQMSLNTTDAADSGNTSMWNSTTPTSSVFSIGTHGDVNGSSATYIAYCFAEKQGFSKLGSYIGNGEPGTNAPFIYTGFKPAFVFLKSSTYAESWSITDNRRLGYNGSSAFVKADASQSEATDLPNPDFLSNGFKLKTNDNVYNKNTQTYIFMAFAEAPLVGTNNVPANAR